MAKKTDNVATTTTKEQQDAADAAELQRMQEEEDAAKAKAAADAKTAEDAPNNSTAGDTPTGNPGVGEAGSDAAAPPVIAAAAATGAASITDLNPNAKAATTSPVVDPGLQARAAPTDLTHEVYAEAALGIKTGLYTLEYAAKGIAIHFSHPLDLVKAELSKILNPVIEFIDAVIAVVPKRFQINLNNGGHKWIEAGTQKMERSVAEHWWSKNNGVKIFDQAKVE